MATENTHSAAVREDVAARVARAILGADLSKLQVAERSGIPYSTLSRKLKGSGDFSFPELYLLAKVCQVEPSTFVPVSFAGTSEDGRAA